MAIPGSASVPGIGKCCGCAPCDCPHPCLPDDDPAGSGQGNVGCVQQIICVLLPQPILDWLNSIAASYIAHGESCSGWTPPACPDLTEDDYLNTALAAFDLISGVAADWSSPPIAWSDNNLDSCGFAPVPICPAVQVIRNQLRVIDGFLDGRHGYEYAWNNDRRQFCSTQWPYSFVDAIDIFDANLVENQTLATPNEPVAIFSGMFWFQGNINNPCVGSTQYENGFPLLVASWSRFSCMASVCESQRLYGFEPNPDMSGGAPPAWGNGDYFIARCSRCSVDSGIVGSLTPTVVTPPEACGIIHADMDGHVYAFGVNNTMGPLPYALPNPPSALLPGGGSGYLDWVYSGVITDADSCECSECE